MDMAAFLGLSLLDIIGNTDRDVICSLLEQPFRERSSEGQLAILKQNRPKPSLDIFMKKRSKKKESTRFVKFWSAEYNLLWYKKFKWLCGSRETNKLYCWPCLLFHVNKDTFTCGAVLDQSSLTTAAHAHDTSNDHKICVATLEGERERFALQQKLGVNTDCLTVEAYNDVVKKNRALFERIVTLVMVFYKGDCALPYIVSLSRSAPAEKFKTMFNLAIEHDYYLKEHSDELGDVYHNVMKSVFCDVMVCIKLELEYFLISELTASKTHAFWSLQVDGANCVNGKHTSAVMLRYVDTSGNLQERHLGFCTQDSKSARSLFQYISSCTEDELAADNNYLVSQSYDGTCISVDELLKLQHKVTSVAPGAVLVPSIDHLLNIVLLDSLANVSGSRRFVFILQDLLSNDMDDKTFLYEMLQIPVLCLKHEDMILSSNVLQQILCKRSHVIKTYKENRSSMDVPPEHLIKLSKFCNNLKDIQFVSFLLVLIEILNITDEISVALSQDRTNVITCTSVTQRAIQKLKKMPIRQLTSSAYLVVTRSRQSKSDTKAFEHLVALHSSVIENVISQLSARFGDSYRQLSFLSLVDSTKFATHNKTFPENALASLNQLYEMHFKPEWLKNELKVFIYNDKQFYNKSPLAIIKLLIANDLTELLPESFKLFRLAATMPIWSETYLDGSCFARTNAFLQESKRFGTESLLKTHLSSAIIDKPTACKLAEEASWNNQLMKRYADMLNDYDLDLEFQE